MIQKSDPVILMETDHPCMKEVLAWDESVVQIDYIANNLGKRIRVDAPILSLTEEAHGELIPLMRKKWKR